MATDDGIVLRIPETDQDPPGAELIAFEPDELEQIVTTEVGGSALFASRFRECAARALLLPRRDPGRRAPLWQQRQRSAQLLEVAVRYPSFPIVLETVREVLQDVYDLPSLVALHRRIGERTLRLVDVQTQRPSPFAQSLLFGYVAAFMYEGDSPIAERRAAALTLDQGLLAELLGRAELRELLDPEVLAEVESELQRLAEDRRVKDNEGVVDLLRLLGPQSADEIRARCRRPEEVDEWVAGLIASRRVVAVLMAGDERFAVVEDVARLRDGLGTPVPPRWPSGSGWAWPCASRRWPGWPRADGCSRESSVLRAPGPSGATPRCCGCCAAARWPGCATRSSPSSRRHWPGSCPTGNTSVAGFEASTAS
jgi:ATP-dependent Lhr-like helicase